MTGHQLALPGVDVTDIGVTGALDVIGDDTLAAALQAASALHGVTQWVVGDLTVEAMRRVRDGAAPGPEWDWIHQASTSKAATVALAFPAARRRASLLWAHHELVHRMGDDTQDRWLDEACRGDWSVRALKRAIDAEAAEARPELAGMPCRPWRPRRALGARVAAVVAAHPEAEAEVVAAVNDVVARWES